MRRLAATALIVAVAAAGAFARARLEREIEAGRGEQELLDLPNGRYLRLVSLGQEPLVADIVYLWAIQFYSNYEQKGRHRYVEHIFGEVIPELDPLYVDPYWLGAMILVVEVGDLEAGLRLMDKGFENNPEAWILPYLAGWEAERAGQRERAVRYFERAADVPGAPTFVRRMQAGMLARAGRTEDALRLWRAVYDDADSADVQRTIAERWLRLLEIRHEIEGVEGAVDAFRKRYGRFPSGLSELVQVGLLAATPHSADGTAFVYDPATGRVSHPRGRLLGENR